MNQFPPPPPKSDHQRQRIERVDSTTSSYPRPAKWESLFEPDDMTPTPIFIALMSTLFSHLDPMHTGYLSPEVYSRFLKVLGHLLSKNICGFQTRLEFQ
jgi:hypothetical protein